MIKIQNSKFKIQNCREGGQILIQLLIYSAVAIIFMSGFLVWINFATNSVKFSYNNASAFSIAEAGIEYYRWHLAHSPTDYKDGATSTGPYAHNYYDKDGNLLGRFILDITPPPVGSTIVAIKSTGELASSSNSNVKKSIKVRMGVPSFSKYAAVINEDVRFGEGTEVFGPIHSNGGVRFDGLAHNLVTSAQTEYNDPDHSGGDEFGVHTHINPVDPLPPAAVPNRPDVFEAGRQFPVPAVDFTGISENLAKIKSTASSSGRYFGDSGEEGYHIVLKTNDTFDLFKVTKVLKTPNGCSEVLGQKFWGTWTIENETLIGNYSFPASGVLFFEDDIWVDGKIDTARLTIASGRFPENSSTYTSIIINRDLLYTNYDGRDSLGLISQGNIGVGLQSEDDLRIDGALIAQNGRVGRYYYKPPSDNQDRCGPYDTRQIITLYGMIGSYERYGFAYTDGTGYQTRNIIYDSNLLYGPPPSFPLTADNYEIISWEEE
jgi:hypothetical protein